MELFKSVLGEEAIGQEARRRLDCNPAQDSALVSFFCSTVNVLL